MTPSSSERCFVEITSISSLLDTSTLRELFECCGSILQIEMCRDEVTNERVCIVEFSSIQESEAAALLSGTRLGDKSIQVKRRQLSEVKSKLSKIKVEGDSAHAGSSKAVDLVEAARRQVEEWANAPAVPEKSKIVKTEADKRREDQISRTIYVGNLCPQLKSEHVRSFFATQGEIKYIKMSGPGMDNPYCFVEFLDVKAAERSYQLAGTVLGDRPIKVGKVKTPIQGTTGIATNILNNPMKLSQALSNARFALEAIEKKKKEALAEKSKSKSKSKSKERRSKERRRRRRRSRSYSPSRSRSSSRSRSRRRRRRRRSRYSSSHSRSRGRLRRALSRGKFKQPKSNMVWDGFNWHPKESAEGLATKKAAQIGAAGPKVGNSPGYVNQTGSTSTWAQTAAVGVNKVALGRELAQKALESFMTAPMNPPRTY